MKRTDWTTIPSSAEFLATMKRQGITQKRLSQVLFGNVAIKTTRAIRKHGQECFDALKKSHEIWYMTTVALGYVNEKGGSQ